ncbi:hypothetical protein TorRG33x02_259860 [Trema orientale]|uniref:Uncharacterized protein n=1 Tax=Trema orientale TaxID=63057 RepID=A0A2P5D783_TREOI|nr:hypothetical protein TorRG33x02_259860 [Trema orientale]
MSFMEWASYEYSIWQVLKVMGSSRAYWNCLHQCDEIRLGQKKLELSPDLAKQVLLLRLHYCEGG